MSAPKWLLLFRSTVILIVMVMSGSFGGVVVVVFVWISTDPPLTSVFHFVRLCTSSSVCVSTLMTDSFILLGSCRCARVRLSMRVANRFGS